MARNEWENGMFSQSATKKTQKQMANRREWNGTKANGTVHKTKRRAKIKIITTTASPPPQPLLPPQTVRQKQDIHVKLLNVFVRECVNVNTILNRNKALLNGMVSHE